MQMITRTIQQEIEKWLFKQKVIIIYGARQVGKTTLVKSLIRGKENDSLYLNCDEPDIRDALSNKTSTHLKELAGNNKIIVIDEAQRVTNIGIALKLLVDNFSEIQVIATGSSSFDLSNHVKEPLTGRKIEFTLYPLSVEELLSRESQVNFTRLLPTRLIYGAYPGIILQESKEILLREITETYLYKDLLEFQTVKNPEMLRKLLQALALQIGSEVSYPELGALLNLNKDTVTRYVNLLIQTNVLFELPPFKSNIRNTLGKMKKVYFCDLGIRNTLINNFNPIELRADVGALWENYFILERMKFNRNRMKYPNIYFWRAYNKAEIDYLEENNGKLEAFECKWNEDRAHPPKLFFDSFPETPFRLVNRNNFLDFLT
jgi:predicted AAA+ superfamily ATPase